MNKLPSLLLSAALATVATRASAETNVETLVSQARTSKLADSEEWRKLLHASSSGTSQVDGASFFLSPTGRTDPVAELDATIRAFWAPASAGDEHALCRFPARFLLLQSRLGIDAATLPNPTCTKLTDYLRKARPHGITLVFSSYYLNNPASMFGHTFMRFTRAGGGGEEEKALLDQGLDFSAKVSPNENSFVYAFRGLFGLYPGTFRLLPYFYKVREYNDFESRDLWEYELDVTPKEAAFVAAHVWEVGNTHFDYYYLDENCSYQILAALDVMRPQMGLLRRTGWPVIPVETVKTIVETKGLVKRLSFRPSLRATFRKRVEHLSDARLSLVQSLSMNPTLALPQMTDQDAAEVLDAAIDLVELRHAKSLLLDKGGPGAALKQQLLERRAELAVQTEDLTFHPFDHELPHRSHPPSRLTVGTMVSRDAPGARATGSLSLKFRPALHDLTDARAGYPEHSQLEFLPVELRVPLGGERHAPWVEQASLARILSLSPWNRFSKGLSYKINAGETTVRDEACTRCAYLAVDGGAGIAGQLGRLMVWTLADAGVLAPKLSGDANAAKARAWVGAEAGEQLRITERLRWVSTGTVTYAPLQRKPLSWRATSAVRWHATNAWAAVIDASVTPTARQATVGSSLYF